MRPFKRLRRRVADRVVDGVSRATYNGAIAIFGGIGLSGVAFGPWEFTKAFPLDFSSLSPKERATFLNQQRFLKALEFGVAVMMWSVRRQMFRDRRITAAVLAMMWITPLARLTSTRLDGQPMLPFRLLMGAEILAATVLTARALRSGLGR